MTSLSWSWFSDVILGDFFKKRCEDEFCSVFCLAIYLTTPAEVLSALREIKIILD